MFFNTKNNMSINLDKLTHGSGKCFNTLINTSLDSEVIQFRLCKKDFYGKAFLFIKDSETSEFLSASNLSNDNITIALNDYGNSSNSPWLPPLCSERKILSHLSGNGEIRLSNREIQTRFHFWLAVIGTSNNLKNKNFDPRNAIDSIYEREQVFDYFSMFLPKDILEEFTHRAFHDINKEEIKFGMTY